MANFGVMSQELQLTVMAKLLATDVGTLLNQAQADEVEAWPWSFLLNPGYVIYSVPVYSTGSVNFTQGSATVTGNGTAFVLTPNTQSYLHFGTAGISQVAVPIASSPNGTTLILEQPWNGGTYTSIGYNIITNVYSIVGAIEVYSVRNILELPKVSREQLNVMDPARLATGGNPSVCWADAGWDVNGNYQIELWEPPSNVLAYVVECKMGAQTMVNSTDLPQLPSAVIVAKCMYKCCLALFASNGNPKYMQLAQEYKKTYDEELDKAKTADKKRPNQNRITGLQQNYGLDQYATHDFNIIRGGW